MVMLKIVHNEPAAVGQGRGGRPPEWISPGEAAELLAVTPRTVRRWVGDGWLTARRISPDRRRLQVRAAEILELLEANTTPGAAATWC
jgi:excisionase family DNA binding protein